MWRGSAIARQRCGAGSEFGRALGTHKPSRGARHSRSLGTLLLLLLLLALAELAQAQRGGCAVAAQAGGLRGGTLRRAALVCTCANADANPCDARGFADSSIVRGTIAGLAGAPDAAKTTSAPRPAITLVGGAERSATGLAVRAGR